MRTRKEERRMGKRKERINKEGKFLPYSLNKYMKDKSESINTNSQTANEYRQEGEKINT